MGGRKAEPSRLKLIRGNPGKRPLNMREPQPKGKIGQCPDFVIGRAKEKYAELCKKFAGIGVLTDLDEDVTAAYCLAWARLEKAQKILNEIGDTGEVLKGDTGFYQNPWLAVFNRALEQVRILGALLGLNPSDRSKIRASDTAPGDPFEDFLSGKNRRKAK